MKQDHTPEELVEHGMDPGLAYSKRPKRKECSLIQTKLPYAQDQKPLEEERIQDDAHDSDDTPMYAKMLPIYYSLLLG